MKQSRIFWLFFFVIAMFCITCDYGEEYNIPEDETVETEFGIVESELEGDRAATYKTIKFLQAKAFYWTMVPLTPVQLSWGIVKNENETLSAPTNVKIKYVAVSGTTLKYNAAINLKVPLDKLNQGYLIAYQFGFVNPVNTYSSDPQPAYFGKTKYIRKPLNTPSGKVIVIPSGGSASYPFNDWNYTISIQDETHKILEWFYGKPISYFWGLTKASKSVYGSTSNLPWYNNAGQATLDGYEDKLVFLHDGGYKGTYIGSTPIIWIPYGWNVLYKMKYATYWNYKVIATPDSKAYYYAYPK
jgi:hypothetical protein